MATSKRATNAEMEERAEFIHRLLDLGLSRSSILVQITKRFDLSRAQGYKELARISSDRQSDGVDLPLSSKGLAGLPRQFHWTNRSGPVVVHVLLPNGFKNVEQLSKHSVIDGTAIE